MGTFLNIIVISNILNIITRTYYLYTLYLPINTIDLVSGVFSGNEVIAPPGITFFFLGQQILKGFCIILLGE